MIFLKKFGIRLNHHWWYDRRISTYDPESVGRTRVASFNDTLVQVCTVSYMINDNENEAENEKYVSMSYAK